MPLTDVAIRNAKPREKPYKMGDTLGLFLLVQPTGGRLWRLKYRVDGREKKLGLGTYPEVGLSEARRRRDEARSLSWSTRSMHELVPDPGHLIQDERPDLVIKAVRDVIGVVRADAASGDTM